MLLGHISGMVEELDPKHFYKAVRSFSVASLLFTENA